MDFSLLSFMFEQNMRTDAFGNFIGIESKILSAHAQEKIDGQLIEPLIPQPAPGKPRAIERLV